MRVFCGKNLSFGPSEYDGHTNDRVSRVLEIVDRSNGVELEVRELELQKNTILRGPGVEEAIRDTVEAIL